MEFTSLSKKEYSDFFDTHPLRDFMNSPESYEAKRINGWEAELVGVKDNEHVVAAAILASKPVMKIYRFYYMQFGPLIDFEDKELLKFFTDNLKKYCRQKKGLFLLCNPRLLMRERDIDGNAVEGGFDNSYIVENMKYAGWNRSGIKFGYSVNYMFTMMTEGKSMDELTASFHRLTRRSINKTIKQGIKVRELKGDDLEIFLNMIDETAQRCGFDARTHEFNRNLVDSYGDHGKVLISYLDMDEYRGRLLKEKEELVLTLEKARKDLESKPDSKKIQNKAQLAEQGLAGIEEALEEADLLEKENGKIVNMASAFFITYDNEMVYFMGAMHDRFRKYNAPYAIHRMMIQEAVDKNIPRYNFYGISGDFTKDAEDYGVYLFKRGFTGVVEELIGYFIIPLRPFAFSIYSRNI